MGNSTEIKTMDGKILKIDDRKNEKFLRRKAADFDFKKFSRKEINELVSKMKKAMRQARGIGLSANQIGLNVKVFVAEVPSPNGNAKFYAVFNPKIEKVGLEKIAFEEGCLSVPQTYGRVERPTRVMLKGYDKNGKPLKIKAWGLLARVLQHEVDHLNGVLFIDKAKNIHAVSLTEKLENSK